MMSEATLHHGDCLDVMPLLSGVDLILCDPPYGSTRCRWDSPIDLEELWGTIALLGSPRTVLMAAAPFSAVVICSNIKNYSHDWVWHKNRATGALNANRAPLKAHEQVLVFNRGKYAPQKTKGHAPVNNFYTRDHGECYGEATQKITGGGSTERYPISVQKFDCERGLHPTQKPVALMEYLINTYSSPGETVLDFAMGSGTTGIACQRTGRNFIGIERDPEYFQLAQERIRDA